MPVPDYMEGLPAPPPSSVPPEERCTLWFRCRRLGGLTNLYYWALEWSLHQDSDWTLGEEPYPFHFDQKMLWLLEIETLEDLVGHGWDHLAARVSVQGRNDPPRNGSIRLHRVEWDESRESMRVVADSGCGTPEMGRLVFTGDDLVSSVTFREGAEYVPWGSIHGALRRAYVNAEQHLKDEQIRWNGGPLFRECANGFELRSLIESRGLHREEVLHELSDTRKLRIREITAVCRADVQRRQGSGEGPPRTLTAVVADVAHSPDFRSVHWFGTTYVFTTVQAACVQFLWQNWEQKTPVLSEVTILERGGSQSSRLRDVFDKGAHPAWGTMIVPVGKGAFRLQEPSAS